MRLVSLVAWGRCVTGYLWRGGSHPNVVIDSTYVLQYVLQGSKQGTRCTEWGDSQHAEMQPEMQFWLATLRVTAQCSTLDIL